MTKTITTTYYTFEELQALGNDQATEKAKEYIQEQLTDNLVYYYFEEFKDSVKAFGEIFNCNLTDWSYAPYDRNYIMLGIESYGDLTNEEKNDAIAEYNNLDKDNCSLTGVYTDFYIFDAVKAIAGKKLTFNDATKVLKDACNMALYEFDEDEVSSLDDMERITDYADANDLYFDKDGNI